jgi:cytidylate kinase
MKRMVILPGNTKYHKDVYPEQAYELALLGAVDRELAHFFKVDVDTIDRWKKSHPEFLQKLEEGKMEADAKVAKSLYQCALGYHYEEEHVFVDKTGTPQVVRVKKYKTRESWACKQWLQTRRRAEWSDTQRLEITQTNINITKIDLSVLSKEEMLVLEKMSIKALTENAGSNPN